MEQEPEQRDWPRLRDDIRSCWRCSLSETRRHALPGEGPTDARALLVAQAPGAFEDAAGRMFVGPTGDLLNQLLNHAGLSMDAFYRTNLVKCHLPKNRRPRVAEIRACATHLDDELALLRPLAICTMGLCAARAVLARIEGTLLDRPALRALRGRVLTFERVRFVALDHPAAALHDPSRRDRLFHDYLTLRELLDP